MLYDVQAEMIGSDVVIAGMVGEQCFAYSYYLTAKEQCNYEGGQVCSLEKEPYLIISTLTVKIKTLK